MSLLATMLRFLYMLCGFFFFPQAGQILKNVLMSLSLSLMVLEDSMAQTPALGLDFRNKMESFSDLNISNSSGRS